MAKITKLKILIFLVLALAVAAIAGVLLALPVQAPHVPIQAQLKDKIVYGVGDDFDVVSLEKDCKTRGGAFNTCGSVCAPDAEVCIQVCAYTCEF